MPTPAPYAGLTVEELTAREYGRGRLWAVETMEVTASFTRTLFAYTGDGLTLYGFMNEPRGPGPFPVVVMVHGYVDPERYAVRAYTTLYADALAAAGYLVLHPNLRGYPPSDDGPNLFRVGYAVDVLNLLALVRKMGGRPGPLLHADPERIGLWGHSMGGSVVLRVLVVDREVDAAVLYASMSADERRNWEQALQWSSGTRGREELRFSDAELRRISPLYYLDRIQAPLSIHHGKNDDTVPAPWSIDLCRRLSELEKLSDCYLYPAQGHRLEGEAEELFQERVEEFFGRHLAPY